MTDIARRLWYLALGAAASWAWHRIRRAGLGGEPMVTVTITSPAKLYPPMVAGFALEAQAILMSDIAPPSGTGDGIDPSTGLSYGDPDDAPPDEQ